MLIPENDLDSFNGFIANGGLQEAENLTNGKIHLASAANLAARYNATVDDSLDYTADGVESLPDIIKVIAGELTNVGPALTAWNEYLVVATDLMDLEQVSQGAEIKRQLDGADQSEVWPSMFPIINKEELAALAASFDTVTVPLADLEVLMADINATITPVTTPPATPEEEPVVTIDPLSPEQVADCLAMVETLTPYVGVVQANVDIIQSMVNNATSSRTVALEHFDLGIKFTMGNSQLKKGSISDATKEVFSTGP